MNRLFLSSLLALSILPLATAEVLSQQQPKSNKESQQQLAEFVQRAIPFLDSDQLQQRQQTEQALIAQGPRVLDLLPTDLEPYSSEIRTRLDRIRQKLYEEVAIQTAGGSSFSLSGVYRLPDVIRELESQTGNLVITSRDIDESIELDLQDVPFYRAFDNILDLAGLDVEPYFAPHPNQILVKPRLEEIQNRENTAQYVGPFRMAAVRINSSRSLRIPNSARCAITLQVSWEPRVRPLYLTIDTSSLKTIDNTGTERTPLIAGEKTLNVEGTAPLVEVAIPFPLPGKDAEQFRVLQGTISAMIPGRQEHFEFSNLQLNSSFPKQQRRAGVTVTVNNAKQTDQQTIVVVDIHYRDAGKAFESHRGWTNRNQVYLVSNKETLIEKPRRETLSQKKQSVTYRYIFDSAAELDKLTFHYHTPALLLERQIKFELNDLPLP
ncbi:MAG: hypothetical protein CMJ76_12360 [Planctomycetaceae bacterium]|nr:hypothetical protein [Planctomycetaceae bacterium]|tara:strand:- start:2814 stop:4121 length:1308 start_codon:yes stop_codon:yes gene_type:complete